MSKSKVMLQNILSKNVIEFDGNEVKVGAQVFVVKVGQYEYIKLKERD